MLLVDALRTIADAEQKLASVAQHLLTLRQYGALQVADVQRYDLLRAQLYATQLQAYGQLMAVVQSLPAGASLAAQIPIPAYAPSLPPANFSAPPAGTSGLGNPIVIAAGGVTLSIPVWAVVIIALAVVVAAVAVFIATVQVITASQQIDANLAATDTYYASQERALLACLQTGRTAQACAVALAAIPPPSTALPQGPQTGPPGGNPSEWPKWFAIGGTALFGVMVLAWMLPKMMGSSSSGSRDSGRYRLLEAA